MVSRPSDQPAILVAFLIYPTLTLRYYTRPPVALQPFLWTGITLDPVRELGCGCRYVYCMYPILVPS